MRRKFLIVTLIVALVMTLSPFSYGTSIKKQKKELKEVQSQKDDISGELDAMKKKIDKLQGELDKLNDSVSKKAKQIRVAEKELDKTKIQIEDRRDGLNKRLRAMYKSGSIGYLDVVLGSNSIEELVTNVDLVQKIFNNDQTILTDLKAQKTEIEEQESKLRVEKTKLDEKQAEKVAKQEELSAEEAKLQARYDELEEQETKLIEAIEEAMANNNVVYKGGPWASPLGNASYTQTEHFMAQRSYEKHPGIDLACPTGTPIYAAYGGEVVISGTYYGYGYAVMINHGNGLFSLYGHCSSLDVSVGQKVKKGQLIAKVGSTGFSTGPHLHYEMRQGSTPIDMKPYIGIN